jgi:hypothetical protein
MVIGIVENQGFNVDDFHDDTFRLEKIKHMRLVSC